MRRFIDGNYTCPTGFSKQTGLGCKQFLLCDGVDPESYDFSSALEQRKLPYIKSDLTLSGRLSSRFQTQFFLCPTWTCYELNVGHPACKACVLPLSYIPFLVVNYRLIKYSLPKTILMETLIQSFLDVK